MNMSELDSPSASVPAIQTIILIAGAHFRPRAAKTQSLLELSMRGAPTVDTIQLTPEPRDRGRLRQLLEALCRKGGRHSVRDTGRFLRALAETTGGIAGVANNTQSGAACADAIGSELLGRR